MMTRSVWYNYRKLALKQQNNIYSTWMFSMILTNRTIRSIVEYINNNNIRGIGRKLFRKLPVKFGLLNLQQGPNQS